MGISEILNLSADRSKKYPERDKDQLVVHFRSLNLVNEEKFGLSEDPVVIYRGRGIQEQVKVLPFNFDNEGKETISFAEKIQYFKKTVKTLKNNVLIYEDQRNLDVTSAVSVDYGTLLELETALKNPIDYNLSLEKFFGSVFLDLKVETINEFKNGIGEILNG